MVRDAAPEDHAGPGSSAWALALVILAVVAYFVPAATWSPMSRFALTRAVVEDGDVTLGAWAEATGDRARRDGHWYSDKAPLPALVATVPYALVRLTQHALDREDPAYEAERRAHLPAVRVSLNRSAQRLLYVCSVTVSGGAAVALALSVLFWLRRRFPLGPSMFGAAVIALATPMLPYATSLFGHVPAGAALFGAMVLAEPRAPRRRFAVAGALLAAAVGCEYLMALPAAVIGGYLVFSGGSTMAERGAAGLRLAAGALPVVAGIAAYHQIAFGGPFETGYAHLTNARFREGHAGGFMGIGVPTLEGLVGLTFGPRRGLFYLCPVLLAAVAGTVYRWRHLDGAVRAALAGLVVAWLANAGYYMWWGGAATGPRHLLPMIAALAPGLAAAWTWRPGRALLSAAAGWSGLTMLAFAAVGLEAPENGETVFGYAWDGLLAGRVSALSSATNLGMLAGLPSLVSLVPLWGIVVFGVRWMWIATRDAREEPSAERSAVDEGAG